MQKVTLTAGDGAEDETARRSRARARFPVLALRSHSAPAAA
jgi:hypothetical protein